jgi:aminopeptidase N
MEDKGMNVFDSAYMLADPSTATDGEFERIEAVIGM